MRQRIIALAALLVFLLANVAPAAIAISTISAYGKSIVRAQLLTNAVAVGDGEWIDITGLSVMSIHVAGITTATVQVRGSNETIKPLDSANGDQQGADITADDIVHLAMAMRWLKVRVSAYTSGTINAYFEGRSG